MQTSFKKSFMLLLTLLTLIVNAVGVTPAYAADDPTLSITNSPVVYNGLEQAATVEGSVAGTVSNILYNGVADLPVDAGTYAVTADFTPDDTTTYNSLTGAAAGDFVIEQADVTISVTNSPVIYSGSEQAAVVEGSVDGVASNVLYDGSAIVPTTVGTYEVTADFVPTDSVNYKSLTAAVAGDFAIEQALPTLSISNPHVTYDGTAKTAIVESSVLGTIENVLYDGSAVAPTNPGTYEVTADFDPADAVNYKSLVAAAAGDFIISDETAPEAEITLAPASPTTATSATFEFSATDDVSAPENLIFWCDLDGLGWEDCTSGAGTWSYTNLLEGTHVFSLDVVDEAGNKLDPNFVEHTWVIDLTAPVVPVVTAPAAFTNSETPAISGTAEANALVDVSYVDDLDVLVPICVDILVDGTGHWSCVSSEMLPEREIEVVVNATDAAGNTSADESYFFTVDLTAPIVDSVVRAGVTPTKAATVDFTVTFSESVTGVNAADFTLTKTGITGGSIITVTGSADTYTVTVNTGSGNGTIRLDVVDNDSIVDLASNSLDGAFTTGEEYSIIKTAPKPSIPVLLAPANGVLLDTLQPDLDWKDSTPAAHHYQLQVATNASFTALTLNKTNLVGSTFSFDADLQAGKRYYWRVRAQNVIDGSLGWSAVRTFKTPLAATTLVAPDVDDSLIVVRPEFDWNDVSGATQYELQVSTANTFKTFLVNTTVKASEYAATKDLLANKTLFWRVRAKTSVVSGPWSAIQSFTTGTPAGVPVLLVPANNRLIKDLSPLFDWRTSTLPAGTTFKYYEIEVADNAGFLNPVIDLTTTAADITDSDFTPNSDLASNTMYYWRVRAVNTVTVNSVSTDHFSAWSAVRSFRTVIAAPQTLTVMPNALKPLQPTLDWANATGSGVVTNYTIQISLDENFANLRVNATTKESVYNLLKDLPTGKTIFWRVRVNGVNGPSAWTKASFTLPLP